MCVSACYHFWYLLCFETSLNHTLFVPLRGQNETSQQAPFHMGVHPQDFVFTFCTWQRLFCNICFQVDSLSKRSKASESAFLSIYKKLVDIPGKWLYKLWLQRDKMPAKQSKVIFLCVSLSPFIPAITSNWSWIFSLPNHMSCCCLLCSEMPVTPVPTQPQPKQAEGDFWGTLGEKGGGEMARISEWMSPFRCA